MEKIYLSESYKTISAFLTFRCNLGCSYCVNKASNEKIYRKGFNELSGEEWVTGLNRLETKVETPLVFTGGEPLLHKDFIYILNNVKEELKINLLTNLNWREEKMEKFIKEVSPDRIQKDAPFPSIRASYHPEQVGEGELLIENAIRLKKEGFNVGIEAVMYPSPSQLEAIERMNMKCKEREISFRTKSFMGIYKGVDDLGKPFLIKHGNYSRYPDAVFNKKTKKCMCKASDILINPSGNIYKCQRDLLLTENTIGNLLSPDLQISGDFSFCSNYGQCHPCDIKTKATSNKKFNTGVEIKDIK